MPHRLRLYAILILIALDVAALIAAHLGVAPEIVAQVRPLVDVGLPAVLAILAPALADALMVERRRRDPNVAAISDDVRDDALLQQALDDARGER